MAEKYPGAKELRALPDSDLTQQLEGLRREQWQHRLKAKDGSLQQTHLLPALKRQLARLQTVLRERRAEVDRQGGSASPASRSHPEQQGAG